MAITISKQHIGAEMIKVSASVVQTAATTITLDQEPMFVQSVRVTSGAVGTGLYCVSDGAGVAVAVGSEVGVCKLDGKVLTFSGNVAEAIIVYVCAAGELR
jgi:hypothetical protein